jgi:DeoR/GlpR family transcriptional regulator of sugar metabolism
MSRSKSTPSERQQRILAELVSNGESISAAQVSEMFGVSLMTAHRDLDALERSGFARKFHGGISALPASMYDVSVEFRSNTRRAEKVAIARYAKRFVEPGMSILLEDSTTNFALAETLGHVTPLTILTNFPRIAEFFHGNPDVDTIMLGGQYSATRDAYLGLRCVQAVQSMRASVYFSSTAAMSANQAFHSDPDVVMVKHAMMQSSERRVLLMDSSKVGNSALHVVDDLTAFDDIVVDGRIDSDALAELRKNHPRIWVAPLADTGPRNRAAT